jgi:hypothetical protein
MQNPMADFANFAETFVSMADLAMIVVSFCRVQ